MTVAPRVKLKQRTKLCLVFAVVFLILLLIINTHNHLFHRLASSKPRGEREIIGAACVREVLVALQLPHLRSFFWLQDFTTPLPLSNLSEKCLSFLEPYPVPPDRLEDLNCFLPEPWFQFIGDSWERVRRAVHIIRDAFHNAGIPLILEGGTALGSWRQHGQIPFDPDMDFVVFEEDKQRAIQVMAAIQKAHPNLIHNYMNGQTDFWRLDVIRPNKSRLFQIDLFVFTKAGNVLKSPLKPRIMKRLDRILPLVMRPFEGALFYTYRNIRDFYFPQLYGYNADVNCRTHYWIPKYFKIKCGTKKVRCEELHYFQKFVHRWVHPDGHLVEVLFNRSHALSVFYSPEGV